MGQDLEWKQAKFPDLVRGGSWQPVAAQCELGPGPAEALARFRRKGHVSSLEADWRDLKRRCANDVIAFSPTSMSTSGGLWAVHPRRHDQLRCARHWPGLQLNGLGFRRLRMNLTVWCRLCVSLAGPQGHGCGWRSMPSIGEAESPSASSGWLAARNPAQQERLERWNGGGRGADQQERMGTLPTPI